MSFQKGDIVIVPFPFTDNILEEGLIKGKVSHLKTEAYQRLVARIVDVIS